VVEPVSATRWFVTWVTFAAAAGCVSFDDFPEGNLCRNAVRDDEGRAIFYPESRICGVGIPDAGTEEESDGGSTNVPPPRPDGGSR